MNLSQRTARANVRLDKFKSLKEFTEFADIMDRTQSADDLSGIPEKFVRILLESERETQLEKLIINLKQIKEFLKTKGIDTSSANYKNTLRNRGKTFTFNEHLEGLICSQLSAQRKWEGIENHLSDIKAIFGDYDPNYIKEHSPEHFINALREIKCGNRNIAKQMQNLNYNIRILEKITSQYGSLDMFVTSEPAYNIVRKLSAYHSPFKLRYIGEALAWEYLRNVGIDGIKPDIHVRRFFGRNRLGIGTKKLATCDEVIQLGNEVSRVTRMTLSEIDCIIWNYCADNSINICGERPHCDRCIIDIMSCNKGATE